VEKRTGLLRHYISRIENGHTVPAIETLEKIARALEVPMYQLFYDGEEPPKPPHLPKRKPSDENLWGSAGEDGRYLKKLRRLLVFGAAGVCARNGTRQKSCVQEILMSYDLVGGARVQITSFKPRYCLTAHSCLSSRMNPLYLQIASYSYK
jgi:transcriptional regulator with XRE-family HTH domain